MTRGTRHTSDTGSVETRKVRHPIALHLALWIALPAAGAGTGWFLANLPDWLTGLPVISGIARIEILVLLGGPVLTVLLTVVGGLAGGLGALALYDRIVSLDISADRLLIRWGGRSAAHDRTRVGAVHLDGSDLVVIGTATEELARVRQLHSRSTLENAFTAAGYPWEGGDAAAP